MIRGAIEGLYNRASEIGNCHQNARGFNPFKAGIIILSLKRVFN